MYRFHRRIAGIFGIFYSDLAKRAILGGVALVALVLAEGTSLGIRPAHAATTWTVTTNGDGAGSCAANSCTTLRAAMTAAMSDSGDTIIFSISNATITLGSTLPDVTTTLTVDGTTQNVTISGNNAVGVFTVDLTAINGNLTLNNLTVANGHSSGLLNVGGTVTITNSTFSGNLAATSGGGLYNSNGTVTITDSTFSNNTVGGGGLGGGGLNNNDLGKVTIINSTFSGNRTILGGVGGALSNSIGGTVTITNSTFSGNQAPGSAGGGLYNSNGTLNLESSIIAENSASSSSPDISGSITSLGHNLIGDATGASGFVSSDQTGVNPLLNAFGNYEGPTQTFSLQQNSPAIGKGSCAGNNSVNPPAPAVTTDQRGALRKAVCDVGAFETPLLTLGASLPNDVLNVPYAHSVPFNTTDPGATPFTFSFTGSLPNGLNLNSSTGLISGTPTVEGTFPFTVTVTDVHGYSASQPEAIAIQPIITFNLATLPRAFQNQPYTQTIMATGGIGPYSYFLVGSPPSGISLSANGVLSGTTTQTGVFTFTVVVVDADYFSAAQSYTLSVSAPTPDTIGVYRNSSHLFLLRNSNTTGNADIAFAYQYGSNPYPVAGNWTTGGMDTVGIYDQSNGQFFLRNTTTTGTPDEQFVLGNPNDEPIAGQWTVNGGHDGIGVFRPSNGLLLFRNSLSTGFADYVMVLGVPGDQGLAGDWSGVGHDGPGVYRPSSQLFLPSNTICNCNVFADYTAQLGNPGDNPVTGDWTAQGYAGIGVFRPTNGLILLKNQISTGYADIVIVYGIPNDVPLAGHWTANMPALVKPPNVLVAPTAAPNSTPMPNLSNLGG